MKSFLSILLFIACLPLAAQVSSVDELEFEEDSIKTTYKPTGKNSVMIRSKRGNSGVNKTPLADAILNAEVSEIVLVYTETQSSDLAEREEANRERWDNLILTYPELFQFSTTYKNLCQCKIGGDEEAFKHAQGFYVYINGEVPKIAEPKVAEAPAPVKTPKVEEEKPVEKTTKAPESPATKEPEKKEEKQEVVELAKKEVKEKETPAEVSSPVKESPKPVVREEREEVAEPAKEVVKATPKKKPATVSSKPRRAKDAKACRQPCYGSADEDLNLFFKENMPLTKKEKRKAKGWVSNVRIQLHHDGSIKKVIVTGSDEAVNLKVQEVIKMMNNWNAAVKNGVAVKAEIKFTLKYDKASKAMKPFEININPRLAPKCKCVSDDELFGSNN